MTETVEAYLNAENPTSYFVVVGAAHMLGETGIITLLLEAGYNVTRQ